jgi:RelB Antitoxin alpha helical domain
MTIPTSDYPFAQEFITDASGKIRKVIIDIADYQKLIDALEDEGLYRAMTETRGETPMSLTEALNELEQP